MIRVLLADDQALIRAGFRVLVVGEQDADHEVVPSRGVALVSLPLTGRRAVTW